MKSSLPFRLLKASSPFFKPHTKVFNIRINTRPLTEITVSNIVHVKNVSLIVNPKDYLMIQNPVSFTCDAMRLPVPVAITMKAKTTSVPNINGITNPAAISATNVSAP
ncbi:hypothetical protein J32TS6_33200 [Virgibacillus pantothenticus]|nr:hypothetical protein J32TS6_33200 [Virgibacillus pantothenticus]